MSCCHLRESGDARLRHHIEAGSDEADLES